MWYEVTFEIYIDDDETIDDLYDEFEDYLHNLGIPTACLRLEIAE